MVEKTPLDGFKSSFSEWAQTFFDNAKQATEQTKQEEAEKEEAEKEEGLGQKIAKTAHAAYVDFTTLDVTTAFGDATEINMKELFGKSLDFSKINETGKQKVTIAGMTRIDLTGDVIELMHAKDENGKVKVTEDLKNLHKDNVARGVHSWNALFRNILILSATVAEILDPGKGREKIIKELNDTLQPIGTVSSKKAQGTNQDEQKE